MAEHKKKKEKNFLVQGSILAIAGVITKLIGAVYRIPLMNIVGDEGMGYYGTAFNVYNIALLLSSYSDVLQPSAGSIEAGIGKSGDRTV